MFHWSRLWEMLPRAQSTRSARLHRPLSQPLRTGLCRGMIVALLALVLGVGLGLRGPVAHAEPIVCFTHLIEDNYGGFASGVNNSGDWIDFFVIDLYADYRSSDGSYGGHTWVTGEAFLHPGAQGGMFNRYLYAGANHVIKHRTLGDAADPRQPPETASIGLWPQRALSAYLRADTPQRGHRHL